THMFDRRRIEERNSNNTRAKYRRPDLESWTEEKCYKMFRFTYKEICQICHIIGLDNKLRFNSIKVTREFAMALLLYRLSFPRRLSDMVDIFGTAEDNIGRTVNGLSDILLQKFRYGLEFDERQFSKSNCEKFSRAISEKGAYYPNIVDFIDGTMQQTCRPKINEDQKALFNGWKHQHCIKFQAISTPDGITSSLSGPYVGRRNNRGMLNESQMLQRLQAHFGHISPEYEYCIYGDEAYWSTMHVIQSYRSPLRNEFEGEVNLSMSKVRVAIEMEFGKVSQLFRACK
ncbi:hypothetical protein INT47_004042, partial [Mucor saturninus]